jgi:hypothetical protein
MKGVFNLLNKGNKAITEGKEQLAQVTGAITEGKEQLAQVTGAITEGKEGTNLLNNTQSGLNIAKTVAPVVPTPIIPTVVTPSVAPTVVPVVTPIIPGQTQTSKSETTWFTKLKPFLTIETTIASFILVGLGVALYFGFTKFVFKEGFFGSDDPVETKEQNSKQVKVDAVERQLQDRITNINTNLTALKKRMDDADIVKNNKPTNLAIAIQNNILAVKEAMMKIIAGLVVQTKMNNGALNVVSQTNAFQQGINDSLKKFK